MQGKRQARRRRPGSTWRQAVVLLGAGMAVNTASAQGAMRLGPAGTGFPHAWILRTAGESVRTYWPVPKAPFRVTWGSAVLHAQDVTVPDANGTVIMTNVQIKPGEYARWVAGVNQPATVTISLLDQQDQPSIVWTLSHAWALRVSGTNLKDADGEVAVGSIVIHHEGVVQTGP